MKLYNKNCNHSAKQQPSLENKPAKVKELQALTISELDAIAGAGIGTSPIFRFIFPGQVPTNHNETIVSLT